MALTGLILLIVAAGWVFSQYSQADQARAEQAFMTASGVQSTDLQSTTFGPGAQGKIYANPQGSRALLLVSGVHVLSPNRVYEAWFLKGNVPVHVGTFTVDAGGVAHAWLEAPQPISNYQVSAITEEPQGGSPQPTGGILLFAEFPSP